MFIRLATSVCMVSFIAGCFSGMQVDIAPPDCTVDEKRDDCRTVPKEPKPMMEEKFFQNETNLMDYWQTAA